MKLAPSSPASRPPALLQRPDGSFYITPPPDSNVIGSRIPLAGLYRIREARTDTPFSVFLRIVYNVYFLPSSADTDIGLTLDDEIEYFWRRGITGASKPDYFLLGGRWHIKDIPDPRGELKNDPLLCEIAASAAEQVVEVFNWRISLEFRRGHRQSATCTRHDSITHAPGVLAAP